MKMICQLFLLDVCSKLAINSIFKALIDCLIFTFRIYIHICIHILRTEMSAIFSFESLLTVVLLLICTCTYIHAVTPSILDRNKTGFPGVFWKCARIGERKSPWVAACCLGMAFSILFLQWNDNREDSNVI